MTNYRIQGKVSKNSTVEVGVRVEAWDKHEKLDDRLGSDKTNLSGIFEIEFSDEDFINDSEEIDWIPDVYFEVYRGKELLGHTVEVDFPGIIWKYKLVVFEQSQLFTNLVLPVQLNGEKTEYSITIEKAGIVPEIVNPPNTVNGFQEYKDQVIDILPTIEQVAPIYSSRNASLVPTDTTGGSLQQILDNALGQVLCRNPQDDPKALVDLLNKTFTPEEINGRITYKWTPCGYSTTQTELGGTVSGAQASLYHRAKTLLDDALRLLDKLYPLNPAADLQNMEAVRSVIRTQIVELINELGTQGGPRAQRVESLFQLLLGDANNDSDENGGQLKDLADIFGLLRSRVNNVDEEQNFSNFLIIRDSLISTRTSWNAFIENTGGGAYLGTQLVLLSQALSVVAESVQETYRIMDSVFLGPAERQAVWIDFTKARQEPKTPLLNGDARLGVTSQKEQDKDPAFTLPDGTKVTVGEAKQLTPAMTLEKLLSWALSWTTKEAPTIAIAGGKLGIAKSIVETATRLMILVQAASFVRVPNSAYQREGVRRAMRDLAFQLYQVQRLAMELIPPLTSDRMPDADDVKDLLEDIRYLLKNPEGKKFISQIFNRRNG
ncbi:hypothetical protein [Iningainema tapete]|uniref:Uncharacterized protein n=1 Tax=Iningainema tapete BLCC-T55 TaxID=2748662 RepID=A0A8J6Y390_9CYAN|nr:hypothetical protein [Iningainema tapete]MBD2778798.1 hypothetical protein [Iningainema tapete BLCC-T55]